MICIVLISLVGKIVLTAAIASTGLTEAPHVAGMGRRKFEARLSLLSKQKRLFWDPEKPFLIIY